MKKLLSEVIWTRVSFYSTTSETGRLLFHGADITKQPPHLTALSGVAHVPKGRRIFPCLTVLENLEMGAFSVKDKKVVKDRMERVFHYFLRVKERLLPFVKRISGK